MKETEINRQKAERSLLAPEGRYWSPAATCIITPGAVYTLGLASGQTQRDAMPFAASSTTAHNTEIGINTEGDDGSSYGCTTVLFFRLPSTALLLSLTLCGLLLLVICWLCLIVLGFITLIMLGKTYKLIQCAVSHRCHHFSTPISECSLHQFLSYNCNLPSA